MKNINLVRTVSPVVTNNEHAIIRTSLCFKFEATYRQLRAILGRAPIKYKRSEKDGKVTTQWVIEAPSGEVCTIYDYKEDFIPSTKKNENRWITWSLGGNDRVFAKAIGDLISEEQSLRILVKK